MALPMHAISHKIYRDRLPALRIFRLSQASWTLVSHLSGLPSVDVIDETDLKEGFVQFRRILLNGFFFSPVLRKSNRLKGDTKTTVGERYENYCGRGSKKSKIRQE